MLHSTDHALPHHTTMYCTSWDVMRCGVMVHEMECGVVWCGMGHYICFATSHHRILHITAAQFYATATLPVESRAICGGVMVHDVECDVMSNMQDMWCGSRCGSMWIGMWDVMCFCDTEWHMMWNMVWFKMWIGIWDVVCHVLLWYRLAHDVEYGLVQDVAQCGMGCGMFTMLLHHTLCHTAPPR